MRTTILGGVIFLIPVVFVAFIIGKAYQISMSVATPIDNLIPVDRIGGVAAVNVLAILLIVVVCYLAGLVARRGVLRRKMEALDGLLIDLAPGYVVVKGMVGSVAAEESMASLLRPVIVAFDDFDQIAFEVEGDAERAVLFLPGAPSAWSGSTVVVARSRVRALDLTPLQAQKVMRGMGRGTLALHRAVAPAPPAG